MVRSKRKLSKIKLRCGRESNKARKGCSRKQGHKGKHRFTVPLLCTFCLQRPCSPACGWYK
jgi:hypothetical protein